MSILSWIIIGAIAGVLGKFIVPGPDKGGIIWTVALGIVGALLGGWVARTLNLGDVTGFNFQSLIIATLGAALLVILVRLFQRRRT